MDVCMDRKQNEMNEFVCEIKTNKLGGKKGKKSHSSEP